MSRPVTKAIFPVAGLGVRFLPATKSVPKELLSLVDQPLIQYAIDEARQAGIDDFIFVTARGKSAIEDYFDRAPLLEENLRNRGKVDVLERLVQTNLDSGRATFLRQDEPLGLGHAIRCAHRLIGDSPFAVVLPDDVILGEPCMREMVAAHAEVGGSMVAVMEVARESTSSYGVIDPAAGAADLPAQIIPMRGLVEKPTPEEAPSQLAIVGRYILDPRVMQHLGRIQPGAGGEYQLTDAIERDLHAGGIVNGFRFSGRRFDCGSRLGFLQASVEQGLANEGKDGAFRHFLRVALAAE